MEYIRYNNYPSTYTQPFAVHQPFSDYPPREDICKESGCFNYPKKNGLCDGHEEQRKEKEMNEMKELKNLCRRNKCTNKRKPPNNWCEGCNKKVDSLLYELRKYKNKANEIISVMNRKYDYGYIDD